MEKIKTLAAYQHEQLFNQLLNQIMLPNGYDTSGSEGSENSEGSEDSEGSENSEGSEDSEGSEGSEDKESCEAQAFKDLYAIDPQIDEWAPLLTLVEGTGLTRFNEVLPGNQAQF